MGRKRISGDSIHFRPVLDNDKAIQLAIEKYKFTKTQAVNYILTLGLGPFYMKLAEEDERR
jgi:hypothetical protein